MHKRKDRIDFWPAALTFVLIVFIWEAANYLFNIKEIILPAPHEIAMSLFSNFSSLVYHASITATEALLGFVLGAVFSLVLAAIFIHVSILRRALSPYFIAIQATPTIVLAPILVLWLGGGMSSKIIMAAAVAFFPVLINSMKGFCSLDEDAVDLFRTLSASKSQIFFKLRFPAALKFIFPALKIAMTFALVGATVSEFTGASKGIGHLIVSSSYYLDTGLMFAGVLMISLSGILLFYLIAWLEKKVVFWEK